MSKPIQVKSDNRYKNGKVVNKNGVLRGNSDTVYFKTMDTSQSGDLNLMLNPPIIVSSELAKAILDNNKKEN